MFATLFTVKADTSQMIKAIKPRRGQGGALFYEQKFSVVLLFGLTELKAQLSWVEDVSAFFALGYRLVDHICYRAKRSGKDSMFIRQ
jgi:hypothetical protein